MPTLLETIGEDIKKAMKARQGGEVSTLRMALSEIKNKQIEKRVDKLPDADVIKVLASMKKKRLEAAATYQENDRADLAEKERAEVALLDRYLPAQLSENELARIIDEAIASSGAAGLKDMGRLMAAVMGQLKGRADGARVSALVKKKLAG